MAYVFFKDLSVFQMVVLKRAPSVIYLPETGALREVNEIMKTCAVW